MKNRIIFTIGLLLLILIISAVTMIGIKYNSKREAPASFSEKVIFCEKTSKFY